MARSAVGRRSACPLFLISLGAGAVSYACGLGLRTGYSSAIASSMSVAESTNSTADAVVAAVQQASVPPAVLAASSAATVADLAGAARLPRKLSELPDQVIEAGSGDGENGQLSDFVLGFVMIQDRSGLWNGGGAVSASDADASSRLSQQQREEATSASPEDSPKDSENVASAPARSWMEEIMAINRKKAVKHDYRMVVRHAPTMGKDGLILSEWKDCQAINKSEDACRAFHERMNNNWEKEAMIIDYLGQDDVKYVLIMDGDAVMVHPQDDTMRKMAAELERTNKDILIADEDWSQTGKGLLNGGLVFVKNTNFSRTFFQELINAHVLGMDYRGPAPRCKNNEQLCLAASLKKYPGFQDKLLVVSGSRWNRHPCVWARSCKNGKSNIKVFDPSLQVVHFMGPKEGALRVLHNLGLVK